MMIRMGRNTLVYLGILLVLVSLVNLSSAQEKKPKRARNREVNPSYIYKRLRKLEDKYEASQTELQKILERIDAAKGFISDGPACPRNVPGFFEAPGLNKCYHLEPRDVFLNWTEAENTCQNLDRRSHLVAIESEDEQHYLQARWKNQRGISTISRFWTSGRMQPDENWQWKTTNGDFKFSNWIPTTAHNDDRFKCMAVFSSEAFYWGDVACWAPHLVTCEIKL